ncbi:MAG: PH domain-containing protein [Candidatus Micrarchaeia archaeon]|jgi:membrane protein YdbS with pleckstrin-like domain
MDAERIHLHRNVKIIWFLPTAAVLLFVLIAGLVLFQVFPSALVFGITSSSSFLILPAAALALGAIAYFWLDLIYKNFTYELGGMEIVIRQGVVTRKTTVIPYATIQDITSERSMLERMLGLATLEIETAGSAHLASETDLPGIADKDAVIGNIMQRVAKVKGTMGAESREQGWSANQLLAEILGELKGISSRLGVPARQPEPINGKKGENGEKRRKSAFDEYENFRKG